MNIRQCQSLSCHSRISMPLRSIIYKVPQHKAYKYMTAAVSKCTIRNDFLKTKPRSTSILILNTSKIESIQSLFNLQCFFWMFYYRYYPSYMSLWGVFFFHMFVDTDTNTDIEMNDLFSFYSSAVSGSILFNSVSVGCCHVLLAINSSCWVLRLRCSADQSAHHYQQYYR